MPEPTPPRADPEQPSPPANEPTLARVVRRRGRIGWVIGGVSSLVLVGVAVAWQADASRGYDEARSGLASSAERVQSQRDELADVIAEHEATLATAGAIADTATATADMVDPATLEAFEGAVQAGDLMVDDANDALAAPDPGLPDESDPRPFWPWDVLETQDDLLQDRRAALDTAAGLRDLREGLEATVASVEAAAPALFASTRAAADRLQAENPSARIPEVAAFRSATDAVAARQDVSHESSDALAAYVAAATQLRASNEAEIAEKAGPLLDRRLAAEAFARSLAGGILLAFDWAPIVNGYGSGGTVGGLATWTADHGGSANITLSDSVAEQWPSPLSQALVAHEVGHAVSVRCSDRFDAESSAANEAWATAWAISRGFTGDGNGASIYGPPPQELIDAAATCG
jgi:hypothetical protein